MPATKPTLVERVVTAMLAKDRATPMLGMVVLSADAGTCCVEMRVREDMLNGYETCHGGILFSLADSAFAIACNSRNQCTVAAGAQIDFLRPARVGDVLRATAVEVSAGKRLGLYDVAVVNQKQQTIALFRGKSCRVDGILVEDGNPESATV